MQWHHKEKEIKEVKVVPYRRRWYCPDCKEGEMIANGISWMCNPPGHHHECDNCGAEYAAHGKYPSIIYKEEEL